MKSAQRNSKFFVFLALLVIGFVIVRSGPFAQYLEKEKLLNLLESIRGEWWGAAAFILTYGIGCVFAFPGSLLTLAGGAVFGLLWGTVFNVVAANLGASLAFFAARYLGRDFIQGLLKKGKLAEFDREINQSGFKTIFRLRLIPVVPFNGLNFGAGLSSVKYRNYFWGSLLGMLPGTFIYTYFADALLQGAQGASQKAFLNLGIASVLLILISFLPTIYKKIKGLPVGRQGDA